MAFLLKPSATRGSVVSSRLRFAAPLLGLALLLGEATVTGLGLFAPRVDPYYASYYITGSRDCWLTPQAVRRAHAELSATTLSIPALPPEAACFLLDGGWSHVEKWGVWSLGRNAELTLPIPSGRHQLVLTVMAFSPHNRQRVKIRLDGVPAGKFAVPNKVRSILPLQLPPGAAGDLHISMTIKHPASPSGAEQRRIGIGLVALHWQ